MFAAFALASPALAQDAQPPAAPAQAAAPEEEEIVVTGIRGSLTRAMDIKRNADGVVDAISQEDIGKMPDTNLAESLQRIPGVSIDRVNGEGSEVTVRGFGGGFNLVTLNGRTMPSANVNTVGRDQDGDFLSATSRSFDFSNLASEGVSGLEVYKTGNAGIPSGGIGATINVVTLRPLDNPGLRGSIGAKANYDTGVEYGEEITPEVSGLFSWSDPSEVFGVALFASFQERDTTTRSGTVNGWNIERAGPFLNPASGRVRGDDPATPEDESAEITNAPPADALVSFANDSRYHLADAHRERVNAMLTLQFRPVDALTFTVDALYANNQQEEQRTDQTNWFNRPFDEVIFEENPTIATAVFMQEDIAGTKDIGFEQQFRATEDTLESFGFNTEYQASDRLTFTFDAHTSKAESLPNTPMGTSSTLVSMGAPIISDHSVDFRSGFPVQLYNIDDCTVDTKNTPDPADDTPRGNCNDVLDLGDLGSQQNRTSSSSQSQEIHEIRLDGRYEFDRSWVQVGVDYRAGEMTQKRRDTQQVLGDWGIGNPGDIEQFAGDLVETYCLACLFQDYAPGRADVAFRANAVDLYQAMSAAYSFNPINTTALQDNQVQEDIFSAYFQFGMEGEFLGRPAKLVAGVRYEETEVEASSVVAPPSAVVWQADNDFNPVVDLSGSTITITEEASYTNVLPSIDFKVDLTDNIIGRVSWSKTLARADFAQLFPAEFITNNSPPRPTAIGGIATATDGNPGLLPLVSDNFDVSLEWYYDDDSYVSVGFYDKRVQNFVGTTQTTRQLYGLRDPSSGAAGTRSGAAADELLLLGLDPTDVNLFTMTALIVKHAGDVAAASAEFQANLVGGNLEQSFVDSVLQAFDVIANGTDPLFNFEVTSPINNRDARIYGIEIAFQHFFGDTGFGVAGSLTTVSGDVAIDVGADPSVDQFALIGLSNTYNITGIYEKYGVSARLTYNWRDEFLSQTNRGGGNRNPVFYEPFGQLDLNVSYDVTDNLVVTFEGINLTEEGVRTFGRDDSNVWFAQELDARYLFGARYRY